MFCKDFVCFFSPFALKFRSHNNVQDMNTVLSYSDAPMCSLNKLHKLLISWRLCDS